MPPGDHLLLRREHGIVIPYLEMLQDPALEPLLRPMRQTPHKTADENTLSTDKDSSPCTPILSGHVPVCLRRKGFWLLEKLKTRLGGKGSGMADVEKCERGRRNNDERNVRFRKLRDALKISR